MILQQTIVALATPPLSSALAMIRLSGKETYNIIEKVFNKPIKRQNTPLLKVGLLMDDGKVIDEVVLSCYFAPKSYTGEDLVEISSHGNVLNVDRILSLLIKNGAKMAVGGDFTKKAYYNGKLNLMQAEALQDLFEATTEDSIDMALEGLLGNTSNKIVSLKQELELLIAHIDVNIDYPEYEDIEELTNSSILPKTKALIKQVEEILKDSNIGNLIKDGINVAIVGKPNVGKSSLLNAFLNEEKAIVSEFEGTTRDVVEGSILLDGVRFNFFDTAGIRDTKDFIETMGIEKSHQYIEKSDLVLIVVDGSKPLDEQDKQLFELAKNKIIIPVINKKDLKVVIDLPKGINVSSLNKDIQKLKKAMLKTTGVDLKNYSNRSLISNARQIGLMRAVEAHLKQAYLACEEFLPIDIAVIDLKNALFDLQNLLGEVANPDLDNIIFANFCLGK